MATNRKVIAQAGETALADTGRTNSITGNVVVSQVQVAPTQVRRPWRATVRTVFQALVALATLLPFVVSGVYEDSTAYPAVVVQVLAVSGALSRVMALPQVEAFLRSFLPFLSAAPNPPEETRHG